MKQPFKKEQITSCPICGAQQFESCLQTRDYFFTQEEFSLSRCKGCGFVITSPMPDISSLSKYYETADYLSHNVDKFSLKGFIYDKLRGINIRNKYKLVRKYIPTGNILDIGQGTGELLNFFAGNGWKTTGIEPNETARETSRKKFNFPVFEERELDRMTPASFDVITMWHVIEHVPDLNGRMQQIKSLLKPNGWLFIAVPILDSPDSTYYKQYWAGLDVPRHLYHFTTDSMNRLLHKHGFVLSGKYPMKFDAYYVSLLSELYMHHSMPYLKALLNGYRSNRTAKKQGNYSSMVFVAEIQ